MFIIIIIIIIIIITGVISNGNRSSIGPAKMNRILFIHDLFVFVTSGSDN